MKNEIQIIQRGITDIPADCIVNAANSDLWAGGGVCGAIFQAAGHRDLQTACDKYGHCDTGNAVITPAFRLPAKYIIHAVGPIYSGGKRGEEKLLYSAYQNSLLLAKEHDCHSIVFPVISSGIFGYPKKEAWEVAIRSCTDFFKENADYGIQVIFAVLGPDMAKLGSTILAASSIEKEEAESQTARAKKEEIESQTSAADQRNYTIFKDVLG